ncbi:MFS general substrate transporter [Venturia nashicola]|uniref:MFS general substrate transporter n=1 Tax=Venturia nashicola TaxID=86259 RepID=A0A4Z1PCQ2_9PEZI|nr:MFS general substrate transporter [Venturia nashicola]
MPRNSTELQRSVAAKSTKSDGDGDGGGGGGSCELELGCGCDNANRSDAENLGPIGDPSLLAPEGPCDGGLQAYLFFGSAFMIEALLWGMPTTFGTFNAFYRKHPNFRDSPYIPIIGALCTSIPFFGAPIATYYVTRYRQYQRQMVWGGFAICVLSLIFASFATHVWGLILFQGAGFGIGVLMLYYAVLEMVNSWFVANRGTAYGALFGAAGCAGIGLPFGFQFLLDNYDYSTTLRIYAFILICFVGAPMAFCRGRYTYTTPNTKAWNNFDWKIMMKSTFAMFWVANVFQGVAFVLPTVYLTRFANILSLTEFQSTMVTSMLLGLSVLSQVAVGKATDKFRLSPIPIAAVSSLISACLCILWLFSRSFGALLTFAILFGFFAGGYSTLWPRLNMSVSTCSDAQAFLYGFLAFGRGLGNIIAIVLSVWFMNNGGAGAQDSVAGFGSMIIGHELGKSTKNEDVDVFAFSLVLNHRIVFDKKSLT